jgi:hypothetical protein
MSDDKHMNLNKKSYFLIALVLVLITAGISIIVVYLLNQLTIDSNGGGG